MSIAVSAEIRPSRLLLQFLACMCLLVFSVGALIAAGCAGELAPVPRAALGIAVMLLALGAFLHTVRNRKTHRLDISGDGQIRLAEDSHSTGMSMPGAVGDGAPVRLAAGSTLWPALLLLRLQTADRRIIVLPVLPDSVDAGVFRPLALACRWVAAHNHRANQTQHGDKSLDD